jgi:anthranilate phosphoribosyltransferase
VKITDAIRRVIAREDLSLEEAHEIMGQIMRGECTDAQIAAYLVALHMKGEKAEEIAGSARAMREAVVPIRTKRDEDSIIDTCGTGGDGRHTFNVSTLAAFVAAGAGVVVAKHGNRSVSSTCGSADLLKQLGVNIDAPPETVERCIDEVGIGFLFAPKLHPAMKYAIGPRREIGVRSVFNILGPLTNPAFARRQVLGVFKKELVPVVAETLRQLGSRHVLVVHGSDGLDELTTTGHTEVAELKDGRIACWQARPLDFDVEEAKLEDFQSGGPEEGARIALEILQGWKGPKRDIVVLNAAAAIYVGGKAPSFKEAIPVARESIDSGAALDKLEALKRVSQPG